MFEKNEIYNKEGGLAQLKMSKIWYVLKVILHQGLVWHDYNYKYILFS